jgi:hypothetical protein
MDGVAKDYISNIGCEIYIFSILSTAGDALTTWKKKEFQCHIELKQKM